MEIRTFKVFCDLADSGSFTSAARMNGVSQSAVSQQIHALEDQFSSKLVERATLVHQLGLTREGRAFYEYSKLIVKSNDALRRRMHQLKDSISRTVRVAAVDSIALHALVPCLQRFRESYPAIDLHVACCPASRVYSDLQSNRVDVGFVAYPAHDINLDRLPIRKDPLVLICRPAHPLAKLKQVKSRQLAGRTFVGFEPDEPMREAIDKGLRKCDIEVNYALETNSIETVKRAVEIGAGIAIAPLATITQELKTRTLVAVALAGGDWYRPVAALWRRSRNPSPALVHFLTLVKQEMK